MECVELKTTTISVVSKLFEKVAKKRQEQDPDKFIMHPYNIPVCLAALAATLISCLLPPPHQSGAPENKRKYFK